MTSSIKELAGPVADITDEEAAWALIAVCRHVPNEDISDVLGMLGLSGRRVALVYHAAYRRAVPDGFRRTRKGKRG